MCEYGTLKLKTLPWVTKFSFERKSWGGQKNGGAFVCTNRTWKEKAKLKHTEPTELDFCLLDVSSFNFKQIYTVNIVSISTVTVDAGCIDVS